MPPGTEADATLTSRWSRADDLVCSAYCSAIDSCLKVRRIPIPLHCDLRDGVFDIVQIIEPQLDSSRSDVLLQAMQLRGAGDRHDPRLLRQQPGERDLRRGRPLAGRNLTKQIDESLVCLAGLRREPRNDIAKVLAVERRGLV